MDERFSRLPSALQKLSRTVLIDDTIPVLLAHPDWERACPVVLWFHGRTVHKELDPGRYLRWIRAGIAVCAVDLPGHGERHIEGYDSVEKTLYVVQQAVGEIDRITAFLREAQWSGVFDASRMAIGGMSAGGMVTLRRCCEGHEFVCATVESTSGDFSTMSYKERYEQQLIDELDPSKHLDGWRAMPVLALHSEKDEWVPVAGIRTFMQRLEQQGGEHASDIVLHTWPQTGAPYEHAGFGRVANDAKNLQLAFLQRHLLGQEVALPQSTA